LIDGLIVHKKCRVCGKENLEPILSLGEQYVINFLESSEQNNLKAPLKLVLCNSQKGGCGLLQLKHSVPGDMLYKEFWYKSGVNNSMKEALSDVIKNARRLMKLKRGDLVVDIGANDGTLLRFYNNKDILTIGFEPATH